MRAMRWWGWGGAVACCLAALLVHALPWAQADDGRIVIGSDLEYAEWSVPGTLHPLAQLHVRVTGALAIIAFLLAWTVAVRARRGRFAAGAAGVLAAASAGLSAAAQLDAIGDYWEPVEVQRARLYALVMAGLGVLILAAAIALMARLHLVHDLFVIVLLFAFAGFHVAAVAILAAALDGAPLTVLAWVPGLGYLLGGVCAAVATLGATLAARVTPVPAGLPGRA